MGSVYEYELTLTRNPIISSAIFALFGTIEQIESSTIEIVNADNSGLIRLNKKGIKIPIDYTELQNQLYSWHFSKSKTITLDYVESKQYVDLWHIAIEQMESQIYDSGLNKDVMIIYYNSIIATLVDIHKDKFIDEEGDFI